MNLLQKVRNFFDEKTSGKNSLGVNVKPMSDSDICLLATMCRLSKARVQKTASPFVYAYYVPNDEKYMGLAKSIFAKSNITMRTHFSRIVSMEGMDVLRTNYLRYNNPTVLEDNMLKIRQKHLGLFQTGSSQERREYSKQIEQLLAKTKELQK